MRAIEQPSPVRLLPILHDSHRVAHARIGLHTGVSEVVERAQNVVVIAGRIGKYQECGICSLAGGAPPVQTLAPRAFRDDEVQMLAEAAAQVAKAGGLASADEISSDQRFMDLGIDSLIAIELRNRLQSNLGVDIPLQNLAGAISLAQLVSLLLEQLTLASVATALPGTIGEDMEEMAL